MLCDMDRGMMVRKVLKARWGLLGRARGAEGLEGWWKEGEGRAGAGKSVLKWAVSPSGERPIARTIPRKIGILSLHRTSERENESYIHHIFWQDQSW